ncbi:MAG TPA: NAD(P)-binding domain-containing protein [Bacteroidales bacterium]|nr:NAD(P)-binding domain-containing protein [Bacteroidales bacterium]
MKNSIGFIGAGRVVRILLQGFKNKNVQFGKIMVSDTNPDVITKLKQQFPEVEQVEASAAASQEIVFIALHPPVIMDTLESLKDHFMQNSTVVSLAPKINLQKLSSKLEGVKNIARLIPNATSYINEGYNPVTLAGGFDPGLKKSLMSLLGNLGYTFEVPEEKLESYAIMSAMLPTYFWFQWRELGEIGLKTGLTKDESEQAIYQSVVAGLDLFYKSGLAPAEVIDLIPVKPIGEHEGQIAEIYTSKLLGLFEKIKP